MFETAIGAAAFKTEGLLFQFKEFQETVSKQLHDAEMENFSMEVVSDFKQVMRNNTRVLVNSGHQPWAKKKQYFVTFLQQQVLEEFLSLNDHWGFQLEARLRTLAVSNNLVKRLPWDVRQERREEFKTLRGADGILEMERDQRPGEPEEPLTIPK